MCFGYALMVTKEDCERFYSTQHSPSLFAKEMTGVLPFPLRPAAADIWRVWDMTAFKETKLDLRATEKHWWIY